MSLGAIWHNLLFTGAYVGAALAAPFVPKVRDWIWGHRGLLKRVVQWRNTLSQKPLWVHVASSGELEQAIPILDAVKRRPGSSPVLLTYFSPSGKRAVELEKKRREKRGLPVPWDYADYSPLDWTWTANRFLKGVSPKQVTLLHREIWPGLIRACKRQGVPVELFAVFAPPRSLEALTRLKKPLNDLRFIGATEERSQALLRELVRADLPVEILGDPRVDRVLARSKIPPPEISRLEQGSWFVAASVWEEDFEALKPTLIYLSQETDWRFLIVPHEMQPKFLRTIQTWAEQQEILLAPWSQGTASRHYLVDQVGFLAEMYFAAEIAFVGGSFKARVHNVLEPACQGCAVVTGPYIDNSGEALALKHKGILLSAATGDELKVQIGDLVQDPGLRDQLGHESKDYITQVSGAAERYAARLT